MSHNMSKMIRMTSSTSKEKKFRSITSRTIQLCPNFYSLVLPMLRPLQSSQHPQSLDDFQERCLSIDIKLHFPGQQMYLQF
mmetsp:Transcript_6022/g.13659  ORF Transcript_6022/g.13659 Transcript_6022/m.13659 type:complete len:81 (+) Transcript_6022:129-371(+)